MTIKEFINSATERLTHIYPPGESRAIAVRLAEHFCGFPAYEYIIEPGRELPPDSLKLISQAVEELFSGRPLQYILGYQEFLGRRFAVREGVLIPRPETEELVMWVIDAWIQRGRSLEIGIPDKMESDKLMEAGRIHRHRRRENSLPVRILDAACGSGCIGVTLACELSDSYVYMCDLSEDAIALSTQNASIHYPASGVEIFREDLLSETPLRGKIEPASLDIIISNPPYVLNSEKALMRINVLEYEPDMALFVPDQDPLLFYRHIAALGREFLAPGGEIYFEINEMFGADIKDLLATMGYSDIEIKKDLQGKERLVRCFILKVPHVS